MLTIFDPLEFKIDWQTSNNHRKVKSTISTFDYSKLTGMIAVGGVEGRILVFDPSAKIMSTHSHEHDSEILDLYYYDKQMQLISVSVDRVIILWDSLRMESLQVIKDSMPQSRFY